MGIFNRLSLAFVVFFYNTTFIVFGVGCIVCNSFINFVLKILIGVIIKFISVAIVEILALVRVLLSLQGTIRRTGFIVFWLKSVLCESREIKVLLVRIGGGLGDKFG